VKISIVGATAYTSAELIDWLLGHPEAEIVHLGGRREAQPPISTIFPSLRGRCDMRVIGLDPADAPEKPDLAFFTLPHQVSHRFVPRYREAGIRCIDFSGDYRFKDLATYEEHYGQHGDAEGLKDAVYGIPELFRDEISGANLVANPGCYPTSVILGLAPLAKEGWLTEESIIVDAKSGVSGRGNKPSPGSMYCECNENLSAYKAGIHRHAPEMEQGLQLVGQEAGVFFVPHLVPMDRGILSTMYVKLADGHRGEPLRELYEDFYGGEPFVRVAPRGTQPRTKDVSHSNYCDIGVSSPPGERAVITSAIDNLARGAASQAVQNMNAVFGLEETLGLRR
jgi:N-acetyl-gamma-glutamyl-phosphate reductase